MKKLFPLVLFFTSCVTVNLPDNIEHKSVSIPYLEPEGGGFLKETAHFKVKTHSLQIIDRYSDLAEQLYSTIMNDTGLYSFVPREPYKIVIYKDKSEFINKTFAPNWSGGITYGNAILLYEHEKYSAILAHEMTHLIFNEFMEDYGVNNYVWINEGLAVYEERKAHTQSDFYYKKLIEEKVKRFPLSFLQMISYKPAENTGEVEKWYAQCTSVIEYILKKGGAFKFYIFLKELKTGKDINLAFKGAYSGIWRGFSDLEKDWLSSI